MTRLVRLNEVKYVTNAEKVEALKKLGFKVVKLEGAVESAPSDSEDKVPTKSDLLKEAKAKGIKGLTSKSSLEEIQEALKAVESNE